jgi:hypothetical protein
MTSDGKTLPTGITLTLSHTDKSQPDDKSWMAVPMKPESSPGSSAPSPTTLTPGEDVTTTRIDLRDFFDLSQPGTYRLHATTDPGNTAPDKSEDLIFTL